MPNNPPSFRLPLNLPSDVHPAVADALRNQDDAITDLQQAIPALKSSITAANPTTSNTPTVTPATTSETVVIPTPAQNVIGVVNDQSGKTAYTTKLSDYGAFIILDDASAVAVTLTGATTISTPWFAVFINLGTGTATLTPASGQINGSGSLALPSNTSTLAAYDGTNWWAETPSVEPLNTPAVAHQWLNSYDAATGAFTQTQPAFSDISGTLSAAQLPATGISVTITTAALTTGGTQGSMTFTDGILTAQTQAT
jgi:hypothetical protein